MNTILSCIYEKHMIGNILYGNQALIFEGEDTSEWTYVSRDKFPCQSRAV